MRTLGMLCLLFVVLHVSQAQALPTIEYFTVYNDALNYPAVEGGTEAANFSWKAVGLREGDEMQMHTFVGGQWVVVGTGFEPEKTDRLVIAHPLDFMLPRYRLSVVDASGAMVAEQMLELNYAPSEGLPLVEMLLLFPGGTVINRSTFDELLHIQWKVTNRWFNSHLVFEQVLPDGSTVKVRDSAWEYAYHDDYVQLVYPGDYEDVVLQLRVVNRADNSTLAQKQLVLHVTNTELPEPELVRFEVSSDTADPNSTLTLSWEVANTDVVFIEYYDGNINGSCAGNLDQVFEDLPASGTLDVHVPELSFFGTLEFRLFADYYVPGDRHDCSSKAPRLGELKVELTDYRGQGVEYFRVEPYQVVVGDTITLSWAVTEGESITIRYPIITPDTTEGLDALSSYQTFENLPMTGTLQITIPDDPNVRRTYTGYFLLYIIEDGVFPAGYDRSVNFTYDTDGNLDCRPELIVDADHGVLSNDPYLEDEVEVSWDSCGNQHTLLRLALVTGGFGAPPVSEEFIEVNPTGTTTVAVPNQTGQYFIQLYYEHLGERYMLRSSPLYIVAREG